MSFSKTQLDGTSSPFLFLSPPSFLFLSLSLSLSARQRVAAARHHPLRHRELRRVVQRRPLQLQHPVCHLHQGLRGRQRKQQQEESLEGLRVVRPLLLPARRLRRLPHQDYRLLLRPRPAYRLLLRLHPACRPRQWPRPAYPLRRVCHRRQWYVPSLSGNLSSLFFSLHPGNSVTLNYSLTYRSTCFLALFLLHILQSPGLPPPPGAPPAPAMVRARHLLFPLSCAFNNRTPLTLLFPHIL